MCYSELMNDAPQFKTFKKDMLPSKRAKKTKTFAATFFVGQRVSTQAWTGTVVGFKGESLLVEPDGQTMAARLDPFVHIVSCAGIPENIQAAIRAAERGYMTFDKTWIYAPDASLDITDWRFSDDLRRFFPKLNNHEITTELKCKGVINRRCQADSEYSCTYVYFKSEASALAFLKRLNALPEIANYVPPPPVPDKLVAMSEEHWNALRTFLKGALTPEKYAELQNLGTEIYSIDKDDLR